MKLVSFKFIKISFITLIFLMVSLFLVVFGSESGLKTIVAFINELTSVKIVKVKGTLLTGVTIQSITLDKPSSLAKLQNLSFSISFKKLLNGELRAENLKIKNVDVKLKPVLMNAYKLSFVSPLTTLQLKNVEAKVQASLDEIATTSLRFKSHQAPWQGRLYFDLSEQNKSHLKLENKNDKNDFILIEKDNDHLNAELELKNLISLKGDINNFLQTGQSTLKANLKSLHGKVNDSNFELQNTNVEFSGNLTKYSLDLSNQIVIDPLPKPYHFSVKAVGTKSTLTLKEATLQNQGALSLTGALSLSPTLHWKATLSAKSFTPEQLNLEGLQNINGILYSEGSYEQQTLTHHSSLTPLSFTYHHEHFKGEAHLKDLELKAMLRSKGNHLTVSGNLEDTLHSNITLSNYRLLDPALKSLKGTTNIELSILNSKKIAFSLKAPALHYNFANGQKLPLKDLNLDGSFKNNSLKLSGRATSLNNSNMSLTLLVDTNKTKEFQQSALLGTLDFNVSDLKWIEAMVPSLSKTSGVIKGSIRLGGRINEPLINSNIQLINGKTSLPDYGLDFSPIDLTLKSTRDHFSLSGRLMNHGSPLTVTGSGTLKEWTPAATIYLNADNFKVFDSDNISLVLSPKITIDYSYPNTKITGNVNINSAKIVSISATTNESLSEDVIIKGKKKPSTNQTKSTLSYHLTINANEKVDVNIYGLTGKLKGQIIVQGDSDQSPHALGQIEIENGKYQAYGQNLSVTQGRLVYTGGRIANPGINLSAVRKISSFAPSTPASLSTASTLSANYNNEVVAGIKLTGSLSNPHVSFFSNQGGLSQSEIFSLLVLGKTQANGFSPDEGKMLLGVLSNTTLGSHSGQSNLVGELQHLIGLDDLSLETQTHHDEQSNTNQEESFLVLGKKLTNRLMVQYGMGFGDSNYLVRFKYLLTEKWSLQVESQLNASGFDVFYHYSRD